MEVISSAFLIELRGHNGMGRFSTLLGHMSVGGWVHASMLNRLS
jgi:hypothetical protein